MLKTPYENIVKTEFIGKVENPIKVNDIAVMANEEKVNAKKSFDDSTKNLLVMIDPQIDFMPAGALGIPGADKDIERLTKFIYKNFEKITRTVFSLDTHKIFQIFHPAWWVDANGKNPRPSTLIKAEDVKSGKWFATINPVGSITYLEEIEKLGQSLIVWPYHCLIGTVGHAVENQLSNMLIFHSIARSYIPEETIIKGYDPMSEMYGIIHPLYSPKNTINTAFLNVVEKYDAIVIAGEAKSHCVLESIKQITAYYANRPEITSKIKILGDCMSTIGGFEKQTEAAYEALSKQHKIQIVNSTDDFLK
jgi:nicotinamidase-related amidase